MHDSINAFVKTDLFTLNIYECYILTFAAASFKFREITWCIFYTMLFIKYKMVSLALREKKSLLLQITNFYWIFNFSFFFSLFLLKNASYKRNKYVVLGKRLYLYGLKTNFPIAL